MKLTFKEDMVLTEARRDGLKYTEKKTKDILTKVILQLEGSASGVMTKLARRYHRIDVALKLMAEKRDELNQKMKAVAADHFDPADIVTTRVIETASFTIQIAKQESAADKESTKKVDYKKIAEALESLVAKELEPEVERIKKLYTEEIPPKDSPARLTVKPKLNEGAGDWLMKAAAAIKKAIKRVTSWAVKYDKQLDVLKKQAGEK